MGGSEGEVEDHEWPRWLRNAWGVGVAVMGGGALVREVDGEELREDEEDEGTKEGASADGKKGGEGSDGVVVAASDEA